MKLLRPRGAPSVKTAARGPRCPNSRTAGGVVLRLGQASTQEIARLFPVEPELARSMNRGSPSQRSSDRSRGARRGVPRRGSGTAYSLSAFQTSSSAQYVAARRTPRGYSPRQRSAPGAVPWHPSTSARSSSSRSGTPPPFASMRRLLLPRSPLLRRQRYTRRATTRSRKKLRRTPSKSSGSSPVPDRSAASRRRHGSRIGSLLVYIAGAEPATSNEKARAGDEPALSSSEWRPWRGRGSSTGRAASTATATRLPAGS